MENEKLSSSEMDTLLNKKSGFKGFCGMSAMRDVEAAMEKGDARAKLAFDMFVYHIVKTIASYFAVLEGKVDGVVFTAGIGENDSMARQTICEKLEGAFGLKLNAEANKIRSGEPRVISADDSRYTVLVVPTNEELEIATVTQKLTAK